MRTDSVRLAPLRMALVVAVAAMVWTSAVPAQTSSATGPETGLPIPRFVSMKAVEANVRRGPSMTHRIDWVFRHRNMPLVVTGEYGHWRRVMDRDGVGGWVHYALLSGVRTVIVDDAMAEIRRAPDPDAPVRARAEEGAIATLETCEDGWCRIRAGGRNGWVRRDALWGVDLPGTG